MKLRIFFIAAALIASVSWAPPASAKKGFKNLKVLADNGKSLKKGMKNLTKGLGVKCTACHIKGKWAKDEVAAKKKSRAFFKAVVGNNNRRRKVGGPRRSAGRAQARYRQRRSPTLEGRLDASEEVTPEGQLSTVVRYRFFIRSS